MAVEPMISDISPEEWAIANRHFRNNRKAVKLDKSASENLNHYFIKVNGEIYAVKAGEPLGAGGFGKVKLCQNQRGENFAVKIEGKVDLARTKNEYIRQYMRDGIEQEDAERMFERREQMLKEEKVHNKSETRIMKRKGLLKGKAAHKVESNTVFSPQTNSKTRNANEIQGLNVISAKTFTITPLYKGGSIRSELRRINTLDEPEKSIRQIELFNKAALQIKQCHLEGIVHADVKADNFMLSQAGGSVFAIDYGLAKLLPKGQSEMVLRNKQGEVVSEGTQEFMAPEIFNEGKYSFKSDTYALAQMLRLEFQFNQDGPLKVMMNNILNSTDPNSRPSVDDLIAAIGKQYKEVLEAATANRSTSPTSSSSISTTSSSPSSGSYAPSVSNSTSSTSSSFSTSTSKPSSQPLALPPAKRQSLLFSNHRNKENVTQAKYEQRHANDAVAAPSNQKANTQLEAGLKLEQYKPFVKSNKRALEESLDEKAAPDTKDVGRAKRNRI